MSNLIPEVRADKNGKLVTRHVNGEPTARNNVVIPSPVISTPATTTSSEFGKVRNMLTDILASARAERITDFDEYDDEDNEWKIFDEEPGFDASQLLLEDAVEKELAKLPDSTINSISAKMDENLYSDDYEVALLHALTFHRGDVKFVEYLTHFHSQVHDLAADRESFFDDPDINSYTVIRDHLNYLRGFQRLGFELPEHPSSADEKELLILDSLLVLKKSSDEGKWDIEDGLARLVIERPEATQRIMEIVEERSTFDGRFIRDILDSESPSVSDGVL